MLRSIDNFAKAADDPIEAYSTKIISFPMIMVKYRINQELYIATDAIRAFSNPPKLRAGLLAL